MKLTDITLEDLKNYFDDYNCGEIETKLEYDEDVQILKINRFSGIYDGYIYVCSIYKASDDDFVIRTECGEGYFNFGEGYFDYEEDDVTIPYIANLLLVDAKSQFGEEVDFWKFQINFVNSFSKNTGQEIIKAHTCADNVY